MLLGIIVADIDPHVVKCDAKDISATEALELFNS